MHLVAYSASMSFVQGSSSVSFFARCSRSLRALTVVCALSVMVHKVGVLRLHLGMSVSVMTGNLVCLSDIVRCQLGGLIEVVGVF